MGKNTNFKTISYKHSGANGDETVSAMDVAAGCLVRTVIRWRRGAGAGQKDFMHDSMKFVPGVTIVPTEREPTQWRLELTTPPDTNTEGDK